jgi:myo-inositol-hexaphosphate 3-phosphohydrolase
VRIENGVWISLVDELAGRVLYQCTTDQINEVEFRELWKLTGDAVFRALSAAKQGAIVEYRIRANRLSAAP